MLRKFIYIVNPVSGTGNKSALKEMIAAGHRQRGIDFEVLPSDAVGNYHYLREEITQKNITDVVVCGGDGSVNAVAYALMGVDVNIGIIPMGSGNGLALSAKIPRQTARALKLIFTGVPSYIDGFYINHRFSCMLCGIGFDAKVAHDFSQKKVRGLKTYIKVAAGNFMAAKPYAFDVMLAEKTFSTEAYFISIANSNQFGNNFTIAPGASLSDGLLDIVIVQKMNKLALPFVMLQHIAGFGGKGYSPDEQANMNIVHFQTTSLSIINPQEAPLHIDGDPAATASRFDIKLVSNALRLIQPAKRN